MMLTTEKLYFRDAGLYMHSNADSELTMSADGALSWALDGTEEMRLEDVGATGGPTLLISDHDYPTDMKNDVLTISINNYYATLACYAHSSTASHCGNFRQARSHGSAASPSAVSSGDTLGRLSYTGHTGFDYYSRGHVDGIADGAPSGTSMPTAILFKTGTTSAIERMRVRSDGHLRLVSTTNLQFGGTTARISGAASALVFDGVYHLFRDATNSELKIDANVMTFYAGGTNPTIEWPTASHLNLCAGGATRFQIGDTGIGFFATADAAQQTIAGARDDPEAALADLLTALALYGLIVNNTTAS